MTLETLRERLDDPRYFGPYTWIKTLFVLALLLVLAGRGTPNVIYMNF